MPEFVLAGDIGGTKTTLCLAARAQEAQPHIAFEQTFVSRDFPDLAPVVQQFMKNIAAGARLAAAIDAACFAVAGPVRDNASELTNLGWSLAGGRLARDLGISRVALVNDFAAIGYGLELLRPSDLVSLQQGRPDPGAPIAYIGAGTGLGQGFLIRQQDGTVRVFPSEGSHADFAPRSRLEFQLTGFLREHHQITRVSVERVVSGLGIASIYQFLRSQHPRRESPDMLKKFRTWERELGSPEKTVDLAAEISRAAMAGQDFLCTQAMNLFMEAYGAEAGNLCLKVLPFGGLYVAGGIAPKILPLLQEGRFMKAFRDKGRLTHLMETIAVQVITNPQVSLLGAAAAVRLLA